MANGKVKTENSPLPAPRSSFQTPPSLRATLSEPDVRQRSLTLMRHKMTFSHFSKDLIRPNLGEESGVGLAFKFQDSSFTCPSTLSP